LPYLIRPATLADVAVLVRQRIAMFTDMGRTFDTAEIDRAFRTWLVDMMTAHVYYAWLVEETDTGAIVAGGGLSVLPWPPGPSYPIDRLAFVYNVYVEPTHRRRGLARRVMEAIHEFCRAHGIRSIALNASEDGRPLYEALGYQVTASPMMFFAVASDQ
jgi:GNAT superfamily N-acetyltransferase